MNTIIDNNKTELAEICKQFQVQKLEVFGSVLRDDFIMHQSDIDFVVEFTADGIKHYADNYFGLLDALTQLFDHSVDLVVRSSVSNPYFLESIESNAAALYAA